ncbi:MAG: xanthine phosphoribosyltransferase [Christensenellaceae bacterium]|nr:xanthine phosphoribosyltransferase [Christensenellaceae bacterium]
MKELEARIRKEGRIWPDGMINLTSFLSHAIDIDFLDRIAQELAAKFADQPVSRILTIESSGIALAVLTAQRLGVPAVVVKKARKDHIEGGLFQSRVYSYTYDGDTTLLLAKDSLMEDDHVLIIDDFLSRGEAVGALLAILRHAGVSVAGVGIAVEKGFEGGGDRLRESGVNLHSLAIIQSAEDGNFTFRPQP